MAGQQKEQRAPKIEKRFLKQTHDIKLAESVSPITKKLGQVSKSTEKLRDIMKESNFEKENREIIPVEIESDNSGGDNTNHKVKALPNSSIFSDLMTKTLGTLLSSANSLRIQPSPSGASVLGVPIYTKGGDKLRICDNDYELTPEIYKALAYTGYTGKTMKNENDILMMNDIINDLGYTGDGHRDSKTKTFFTKILPKLVEKTQNKTFDKIIDDSDGLQGEGGKIVIPANIFDIYTRLELLLGSKLSNYNDTLTEASISIDEL